MRKKTYIDVNRYLMPDGLPEWTIWINRQDSIDPKHYLRRHGSPSALRCARMLAKIAESEAKQ